MVYTKTKKQLIRYFGNIDYESMPRPFNFTDYYGKELGAGLNRYFISFEKLLSPKDLAKIKIITNKLEKKFSVDSRRKINIDPGYLNLSKLVLATTKDYKHRIYLDKGIYAEVTLYYQARTFKSWPWTYPDYKTKDYIDIFNEIRQIYQKQLKCLPHT
ncbi:MAG: DUF4416 family protein [Candidatus Omnitrophica bacterium]|nr:DUF4416 family protein [Candidatus Omnitrophota bacterium]